jgi:O-antigen/teichoic acid export membrane protein
VRLSVSALVERMRPGPIRDRLAPLATIVDETISPVDDRSVARRVAALAFTTRVFSAMIALGSQALMARWLGEHEYGVFVVVWVAVVLLSSFASFGFQVSPLRFIPEYLESKQDGLLRGIIVGARLYGLASSTIIALIGAGALWLFGDHLASYYVMPFFLAAICLPMIAVGEIQDGISRAFSWPNLSFGPTFIYRPLLILTFMWLALHFGAPANAITAMSASIGGCYVMTAVQAIGLHRRFRKTIPPGPRQYRPVSWIAISMPMFLVEGFYNLMTNVDILAVGALMEPSKAAVYFATVKTLALVHFVYFAVRAAAANKFSKYHYSGNRARLTAFLRDTLHWTFWPSVAISLVLLVLGKPLLSLFGASFTEGAPLLYIFVIGLIARASVGPAESLLTMAGEQRICAAIYVSVFAVNAALNFLLIPYFGLYGAAMATSFAFIIEAASLALVVYTRLGFRSWIGFALSSRNRPAEVG